MKDPALLWYFNDWMGGTATLTRHQKGCYIDLLCVQFNSGPLSLDEIKTVLGSDFGSSWPTLQKKFKSENGLYFNERLALEKYRRATYTESRRNSANKANRSNVRIYLVKDNETGTVKIGSSVNPAQRFYQLKNQANDTVTVGSKKHNRDYVMLWTSKIIDQKVEGELHQKYADKRFKGEWFSLSEEDINEIISLYSEETDTTLIQRTEDINENINKVFNSVSYLQNVPESDISELRDKYDASPSKIKEKALALFFYCNQKGKKYKNYKMFLHGALLKDFGLRRQYVKQENKSEALSDRGTEEMQNILRDIKPQFLR